MGHHHAQVAPAEGQDQALTGGCCRHVPEGKCCGGSAAYLGKMLPREKNKSEEESCKVQGFKPSQSWT